MTYTIVMVVCLIASPASCRSVEYQMRDMPASPVSAFLEAQTRVAAWQQQWKTIWVKTWRLDPGQGV